MKEPKEIGRRYPIHTLAAARYSLHLLERDYREQRAIIEAAIRKFEDQTKDDG